MISQVYSVLNIRWHNSRGELERRADELLWKGRLEAAHPLKLPARTLEKLDEVPERALLAVRRVQHLRGSDISNGYTRIIWHGTHIHI